MMQNVVFSYLDVYSEQQTSFLVNTAQGKRPVFSFLGSKNMRITREIEAIIGIKVSFYYYHYNHAITVHTILFSLGLVSILFELSYYKLGRIFNFFAMDDDLSDSDSDHMSTDFRIYGMQHRLHWANFSQSSRKENMKPSTGNSVNGLKKKVSKHSMKMCF